MQLVAVGAQDIYLTSKPTITFFQSVYKRATPFAMEVMEQVVNGSVQSSGRVSVTIARNGDLIGPMYLELDVKTGVTALDWVAEKAISSVELSIGGQRIDRHYAKWFALYSELHHDADKKACYGKMTTGVAEGKVYLPLQFFFNRTPGLYLPLIALQYHEVRLDIDLASDFADNFTGMKVWGTYIFLDAEERKRYATKQHEMLIEQVQHTGQDSVSGSSTVRLSFNHPVKELVAAFTLSSAAAVNRAPHCTDKAGTVGTVGGSGVPAVAVTEEAQGPLTDMILKLNGQDRQKVQAGKFYNQVMPYYYYDGCPQAGVYAYPFALRPGDAVQPSGSCNFSRIDNAQLTVNTTTVDTMHLFATNWNVLRIASGLRSESVV